MTIQAALRSHRGAQLRRVDADGPPAPWHDNPGSRSRSELPCCTGLMQTGPLPPGISGVAALNPTMATMMSGNPMMAGMMGGTLMGGATGAPFQEGWLKLRGIPFNVAKSDIIRFFAVGPIEGGLRRPCMGLGLKAVGGAPMVCCGLSAGLSGA